MFRKVLVSMLVPALAVAALSGCAKAPSAKSDIAPGTGEASAFPTTVTDDAGRKVFIRSQPTRIVSLAPANTEIVAALGLGDRLVGVTTYDDFPPEVKDLPKMGDFQTPNLEAIAGAKPDLVLATTGVQADTIAKLEELGAAVVAVDPQSLDDLYGSIRTVATALGVGTDGDALVAEMKDNLADIEELLQDEEPVECFVEIAQEPLYTAGPGTLLDDLVKAAGGRNVVDEKGYVAYSVEQLLADDPDVYLATMGSMNDAGGIGERPGYADLTAVQKGRVGLLDDNLVSRPGPRVVMGVEDIARQLHPEAFE